MEIEKLSGFQLESVSFGIAFYTLEFQGKINGEPKTYRVGTNYNLSPSLDNLVDVGEDVSKLLWGFLGCTLKLTEVDESGNNNSIMFLFDNGESFAIWQEKDSVDNLLIVREAFSDEWFPVL